MTRTVTPRRTAAAIVAAAVLTVAYLLGTSHSGGAAAASAAAASAAAPTATSAPSTGPSSGITVTGTAKVAGTPDTLRLDLSVTASASSVSAALAKANTSEAAVQKALLAHGVAKKDLQTSGLSIQPNYTYPSSGRPTISGYQASESLSARMHNLAKAGDVIGAAVSAGGNAVQVNGLRLDLDDTGALVSAARDKAFSDAKAKAEQYAKAAGRDVGDVVSITESVQNPAPQPYAIPEAAVAKYAASGVPIQAGSQDVGVTVTVVFSIR